VFPAMARTHRWRPVDRRGGLRLDACADDLAYSEDSIEDGVVLGHGHWLLVPRRAICMLGEHTHLLMVTCPSTGAQRQAQTQRWLPAVCSEWVQTGTLDLRARGFATGDFRQGARHDAHLGPVPRALEQTKVEGSGHHCQPPCTVQALGISLHTLCATLAIGAWTASKAGDTCWRDDLIGEGGAHVDEAGVISAERRDGYLPVLEPRHRLRAPRAPLLPSVSSPSWRREARRSLCCGRLQRGRRGRWWGRQALRLELPRVAMSSQHQALIGRGSSARGRKQDRGARRQG
jgi:hypothetical protein